MKWLANCLPGDAERYIRELKIGHVGRILSIGLPQATGAHTSSELIEMQIVGIYEERLRSFRDNVDPCPIVYIDAIRDLLSGAGVCRSKQTWEATEERIAAMKDACNFLVYAEIRNKGVNPGNVNRAKNAGDVLRAMLEEAEHGTKNRR